MAREDTLALLAKVVDGLKPLGDRVQGAPLRAEDWNRMVGAISDLASLAIAREADSDALLEQRFARVGHDHTGAATLAWFDPPTRKLLEEATGGSVEQSTAIARLEKQVSGLNDRIRELSGQIAELRVQIDGSKDVDIKRARDLEQVQLGIERARDVEGRVTGLAAQLGGFDESRRKILAFQDSLRDPAGVPIDLAQLGTRVAEIDDLRGRLTLANGQLASLRDFERSITRLDKRGTGAVNEMRDLVREAVADPAIFNRDTLREEFSRDLDMRFADRFEGLNVKIGEVDARATAVLSTVETTRGEFAQISNNLGGLVAKVDSIGAVDARVKRLTERLTAAEAVGSAARAQAEGVPDVRRELAELSGRTQLLDTRLQSELGRVDGSVLSLSRDLSQVQRSVDPTGPVGVRLADLAARVDAVADVPTRLERLQGQVTQQGQLLDGARASVAEFADRTRVVSELQEGLGALQRNRAATDQQLQSVLARLAVRNSATELVGTTFGHATLRINP